MHLRQLQHLRKELKGVQTLGANNNYRLERLRQQQNINYKSKYYRLMGELSQSNIPEQITAIQARHRALKKAYNENFSNDII
jgi:hypothetical protein